MNVFEPPFVKQPHLVSATNIKTINGDSILGSGDLTVIGGSGNVATDTIWDAAGDLVVGAGANTASRLAKGTALQVLQVNAGGTTIEYGGTSGTGDIVRVNGAVLASFRNVEVIAFPLGTTQTLTLADSNSQTIWLDNTSGNITITLTVPSASMEGTLSIVPHASDRSITWAVSSGAIVWIGDALSSITGGGAQKTLWWKYNTNTNKLYIASITGDQTSIAGITGTKAQFDTACTDGNFAYQSDLTLFDPVTLSPAIYLKADTINLANNSQVLRWHDLSGNGRDYIGVSANAPRIYNGFNNGKNSLNFTGAHRLSYAYTGATNNYVITMLVRPESAGSLSAWSADATARSFGIESTYPQYVVGGVTALADLTTEVADKWVVLSIRVVGTSCKVYVGRNQVASSTISAGVLRGDYLGYITSGSGWVGKIQEVFVKDGTLTDAEFGSLVGYMSNEGGIKDQVYAHFIGDSITAGYNSGTNSGFVEQLARQRTDYRCYAHGVPGDTIALATVRAAAADRHALRADGSNVCVAWVGTNDTFAGTAAATTIAAYATFCADRRTAGYKVIAVTQISRNDAYTTNRNTFNSSVRANWATYADGLCDLALLSELSNYADTTYFDDGTHPTDAGHSVIARAMETAIDALDLLPTQVMEALRNRNVDGFSGYIQTAINAVANATHTGDATGATALTVVKINGTLMSGLATGILKNTTGTGVPSIAVGADFPTSIKSKIFGVVFDGGGSAPTANTKRYWRAPWAGTIAKVTLLADVSGSAVIDVWKDTYANYPPTVADTITAAAKPTLSAATKYEDSTLTGWTTSVAAGDVFGFNLDSASTSTVLTLEIEMSVS